MIYTLLLNYFVRFGSVHYTCIVYINGKPVLSHSGGHIAFQGNISEALSFSQVKSRNI